MLAYFPELGKDEKACIKVKQVVIEMYKTKLMPESYKDAHEALLRTSSELQSGVLKSMRSVG